MGLVACPCQVFLQQPRRFSHRLLNVSDLVQVRSVLFYSNAAAHIYPTQRHQGHRNDQGYVPEAGCGVNSCAIRFISSTPSMCHKGNN